MSAIETMGDKRPVNLPGLYRREDGVEIETGLGVHGRVQADAIVQQGFKYVGPKSEKAAKTETPKTDK